MTEPTNGGQRYKVDCSQAVAQSIIRLQQESPLSQRKRIAAAFRQIVEQLQLDPNQAGEPLYRLSGLRLMVRTMGVRPLVVDFAVSEDHPVVFIKIVKLLNEQA